MGLLIAVKRALLSSGRSTLPPDIGARVYNSSDLVIADDTNTSLTYDSERWDTDDIHDTGSNTERFTCKTAGKYLICCHIDWEDDLGDVRLIYMYLNGSDYIAMDGYDDVDGKEGMNIFTIWNLAVNDYVEVVVHHIAGNNLNVQVLGNYSAEYMIQLLAET